MRSSASNLGARSDWDLGRIRFSGILRSRYPAAIGGHGLKLGWSFNFAFSFCFCFSLSLSLSRSLSD